jgi:hypothetical protein
MLRIQVFVAGMGIYLLGSFGSMPARADDELLASVRLRGGYDSNPQFSNGGTAGSAFINTEVGLAAAGKQDDITWNATAEANATRYIKPGLEPSLIGKIGLRGTMGDDDLRITTTTSFNDVSTYNQRSTDLVQSLKLETVQDKVKWFVTGEAGLSRLNQTNVIFQDFLPTPLQYWRGTIIPGVSVKEGKGEIGVSVNLSARRYAEEFDLFGFRRDNERVQPFVFGRYDNGDISAFASVSQLYGYWHDVDFSNVNTTLYDGTLVWRPKPFTVELTAARRANETTFPISPITIDTVYSAKGSWQVDDKWQLTAAAGYSQSVYLDSPYRASTFTYGLGAVRDVGSGLKFGVDVTRVTGTLLNGENAQGYIVASSLTKSFTPSTTAVKKDEAATPVAK